MAQIGRSYREDKQGSQINVPALSSIAQPGKVVTTDPKTIERRYFSEPLVGAPEPDRFPSESRELLTR